MFVSWTGNKHKKKKSKFYLNSARLFFFLLQKQPWTEKITSWGVGYYLIQISLCFRKKKKPVNCNCHVTEWGKVIYLYTVRPFPTQSTFPEVSTISRFKSRLKHGGYDCQETPKEEATLGGLGVGRRLNLRETGYEGEC